MIGMLNYHMNLLIVLFPQLLQYKNKEDFDIQVMENADGKHVYVIDGVETTSDRLKTMNHIVDMKIIHYSWDHLKVQMKWMLEFQWTWLTRRIEERKFVS